MNFFDRFDYLSKSNSTSVNAVAKELGLSSGSVTAWKNGTKPNLDALTKIADYFKISTDYLLGKTDNPAPLQSEEIKLSEIDYALLGEAKELDAEDKQELLRMAKRMRELKELKKNK